MTNDEIIDAILDQEGGFVNDPADPGGATNYGITQATLAEYRRAPVTVEDVKSLSRDEARAIYLSRYILSKHLDQIQDWGLRALVVDCSVNHGEDRAIRWLQSASGAAVDGVVGTETIEKANGPNPKVVIQAIVKMRIEFYAKIVQTSPVKAKFLLGWLRRAMSFLPPIA